MSKEMKWGLFVEDGDKAVKVYPLTDEGYREALYDLNRVYSQLGFPHELKKF